MREKPLWMVTRKGNSLAPGSQQLTNTLPGGPCTGFTKPADPQGPGGMHGPNTKC